MPTARDPRDESRSASAPPRVADQTAWSIVKPMSLTATAMQNGIEVVKLEPGLQSVASATFTPAANNLLASGYELLVENSAPGKSVATVLLFAKSSMSLSLR